MIDKAETFCSATSVAEASFPYYYGDTDDPLVSQEKTKSDY
jgi:hypothetical protein